MRIENGPDLAAAGRAIVYRLYDVGYEIDLQRTAELLEPNAPARQQPRRAERAAFVLPNPPVTAALGRISVVIDGASREAEATVACYDFGVVSLRLTFATPGPLRWQEWEAFGGALEATNLTPIFDDQVSALLARLAPAITRPHRVSITEDYIVFRLGRFVDSSGRPAEPTHLRRHHLVRLLLNETRPLTPAASRDLLPHRFSYTPWDCVVLSWDNALVVEPDESDHDVEILIEFANAQLLEFRLYDALLEAELPKLHTRIQAARSTPARLFSRRFQPLLVAVHELVADTVDLIEKVDNAMKVTDDVYLARIYMAALALFREPEWRRGVDRKIQLLRSSYEMLADEAQTERGQAIEIAILVLILGEILIAILR